MRWWFLIELKITQWMFIFYCGTNLYISILLIKLKLLFPLAKIKLFTGHLKHFKFLHTQFNVVPNLIFYEPSSSHKEKLVQRGSYSILSSIIYRLVSNIYLLVDVLHMICRKVSLWTLKSVTVIMPNQDTAVSFFTYLEISFQHNGKLGDKLLATIII